MSDDDNSDNFSRETFSPKLSPRNDEKFYLDIIEKLQSDHLEQILKLQQTLL
jgi:hypothetical protein